MPFTRHSRLSFPATDPDVGSVLRSDVVLLGLNPGNAAKIRPDGDPRHDYLNFHTGPKHNDHLIAEAFRGTDYWGSYMTDLYKVIESKSALVKDEPTDVEDLISQIRTLNEGGPVEVIAFGARTFDALKKHPKTLDSSGLVKGIRQIPHYSGANNGKHKADPTLYRELVHHALGLRQSPRS
jgi:hypothetical protein